MKIYCNARTRYISLRDCVPNLDHPACKDCKSPNRYLVKDALIAARSPLQGTSEAREIADLYLKDAANLPYPFNQPDELIDINHKECLSQGLLKTLTATYPEDIVKRVCMALLKFDLAIFRFDFAMKCNKPKIEAATTREENLKGIDAALASHSLNRLKMPSSLEADLKDWKSRLVKEKDQLSIKPYTPSNVLGSYWMISPPFNIPAKRPNNPLVRALQIVIYRLLDNGNDKGKKQELTAKIINDFYKNYDCLSGPKKSLTAKTINDSLFTDKRRKKF